MKKNKDKDNFSSIVVDTGNIKPDVDKEVWAKFNSDDLPIMPLRNTVLFPNVTMPISLVRENSLSLARDAYEKKYLIGVVCQIDPEKEEPDLDSLFGRGVLVEVVKILELPDGSSTAIIRGLSTIEIVGHGLSDTVHHNRIFAQVEVFDDIVPKATDYEYPVLIDVIKGKAQKIISKTEHENNFQFALDECPKDILINMVSATCPIEPHRKQMLLTKRNVMQRGFELLKILSEMEERLSIIDDINRRTHTALDNQQRNAFLQQQMDSIRTELYGDEDDEASLLRKRAKKTLFPDAVRETFNKELSKLERTNPQSPDYSVSLNYLEMLLDLPWGKYTPLNYDFVKATQILNDDHYGLEKVKDRILEQLAVMVNNPEGKSPIICLVGPPGVGKTSLGKSIARALGREYQHVSLGGLHDEAEIRGHRRTYVAAMPGRIIDAIKRAGSSNPVLLLDEVDKIGNDYKGDPSAALLEVLDPEQNCRFHDNYIDVDFDLSKVLFIATANTLQTLAQPLLDRMEIIEIPGYLLEEKIEIAKQHIIPRLKKEHKLKGAFRITDDAIAKIIESYTSESGVRQLEKQIATIIRKVILRKVSNLPSMKVVKAENLHDMLGVERYSSDRYEGNDFAGVVTGLAWTAVGGEILFVESSLSKGKGEKLTITGNLGDVMKESATIALQYVKANCDVFGIDDSAFEKYNVHIHVPEGAIPKDGPSAGITMATSLISAFTRRKVKANLAMTGEITLRGKVLPVGGIKEKILAAKRAGIKEIIISDENRKDIDDISAKYIDGLTFHYVKTVKDVYNIALTDEIAE
ncbi:MAG: endopeptidase La [Muribaculaceae bacterium]|nr:endopeptidase La [Muribaculaceae bacterium]